MTQPNGPMPEPEADPTSMVFSWVPGLDFPFLLLGFTPASIQPLFAGPSTHTLDLTQSGIPVRLIVYGAPDRETCLARLKEFQQNTAANIERVRAAMREAQEAQQKAQSNDRPTE